MGQSVIEHRAAGSAALNVAVITVSDTRTLETDTSGALIVDLATEAGHCVVSREIVRDEPRRRLRCSAVSVAVTISMLY